MISVRVTDRPGLDCYEVTKDGLRAGQAHYKLDGGVITFTDTEIDPLHAGQGLGGTLAQGALDDARSRGLRVRPACPFIRGWIRQHPDYADLVV